MSSTHRCFLGICLATTGVFAGAGCESARAGGIVGAAGTGGEPTPAVAGAAGLGEHVILLHGLVRSGRSMVRLEKALQRAGYQTHNHDYPSRRWSVQELTDGYLAPEVERVRAAGATKIHFVAHSMGGILVRDYLDRYELPELGRVVMFAPPNRGSEVVDKLGSWRLFGFINGPAGRELGTGPEALPARLPPVRFECGVIAGDRTINWINSLMIQGPDDGKVSIERTRVAGISDHVVVHRTHPMIMRAPEVAELTLRFLARGRFGG